MVAFWDDFEKDGKINLDHPVFQQGRNLNDANLLVANLDAGNLIEKDDIPKVRKLLVEFCRLINGVGQLRAAHRKHLDDKEKATAALCNLLDKMKED